MKQLNIQTGLVEFEINKAVKVKFNPTDVNFIERVVNAFNELEKLNTEYGSKLNVETPTEELFKITHEADNRMRDSVNAIFGEDICTPLIGNVHIFAISEGLPIWANILLALLEECDATAVIEQQKTNPRLEKYIKKYEKGTRR